MEIRVLGPLEVLIDAQPAELPAAKARLLFAALAVCANEVVSTDRLFEVLWVAEPPKTAANTLQTYVAHLRGVLEPDRARRGVSRVLVTREPGYVLPSSPTRPGSNVSAIRAGASSRQHRPMRRAPCGPRTHSGGARPSPTSRSSRSRKPPSLG